MSLFIGFLSEKIQKRVQVHKNFDSLHKSVPKSILPKEYGGDYKSISEISEDWNNILIKKRNHFLEDVKYGTDESLRPGIPKNPSTLFGVEGSFRSLNID